MSILEQLKQVQKDQRQNDLAEYYALLASIDFASPSAAHKAKLVELMTALRLSPEKVESDHREIVRVRKFVIHSEDLEGKAKRAEAAYEKYIAACSERTATIAALNQKVTAALLKMKMPKMLAMFADNQ